MRALSDSRTCNIPSSSVQRPAWLASMTTRRRQAARSSWQWDSYVEPSLPQTGRRLDATHGRSHVGTQTGVALATFIRHRSPSPQLRPLHVNPPADNNIIHSCTALHGHSTTPSRPTHTRDCKFLRQVYRIRNSPLRFVTPDAVRSVARYRTNTLLKLRVFTEDAVQCVVLRRLA